MLKAKVHNELNAQLQFHVNKRINLKMAPTDNLRQRPDWDSRGYSANSYKERQDLYHYRQHMQNEVGDCKMPFNQPVQIERAHKNRGNIRENKDRNTISVFFGIVFHQQKRRNLGAVRGVWPVGTPYLGRVWVGRVFFMGLPVLRFSSHKS